MYTGSVLTGYRRTEEMAGRGGDRGDTCTAAAGLGGAAGTHADEMSRSQRRAEAALESVSQSGSGGG